MYSLLRPLLFQLEPEAAHRLTLLALRFAGSVRPLEAALTRAFNAADKPVQAFGLTFKNPVGLAAGYDKDALAVPGLAALGFGHLEIGTVTPLAQPGNPSPRLFRLIEDQAVINRLGFPSAGAALVVRRLQGHRVQALRRSGLILGVNLGKNRDTPLEGAAGDYVSLIDSFAPVADYLTINISSPNTEGLRSLQGRLALDSLLAAIAGARTTASETRTKPIPVLIKIAPDLSEDELDDAIGVILDRNMDGILATNTTTARAGLSSRQRSESGGLSGAPLSARSEAVLRHIVARLQGRIPVISVGGIMTPDDARRRLDLGAVLVQVYTGLVYRGPGLARLITRSL
jgi:dihydroorotate dehydrogenase